jgi:Leucine-rich repeat (LRR) protein
MKSVAPTWGNVYSLKFCVIFLRLFIFCILPLKSSCQLLDSLSLDTMIGNNNLQEAMANPGSVVKLDLSKQKLKSFPDDIRKLTNLQYLDLSRNRINKIPDWIGELKNLQFLILFKNKIDSLPSRLGDLNNLKYLILNRNGLTYLPHSIGNLKELLYLDLWDDNISSFPSEIKYLSGNLQTLDLRDMMIGRDTQANLKTLLPTTTIYFTPGCPCER